MVVRECACAHSYPRFRRAHWHTTNPLPACASPTLLILPLPTYHRQVLDDSYRRALALPVNRFASTFDLSAHHILHDVHAMLMPDAQSVRSRLHKLNVYGPGGFFKAHKVLHTDWQCSFSCDPEHPLLSVYNQQCTKVAHFILGLKLRSIQDVSARSLYVKVRLDIAGYTTLW